MIKFEKISWHTIKFKCETGSEIRHVQTSLSFKNKDSHHIRKHNPSYDGLDKFYYNDTFLFGLLPIVIKYLEEKGFDYLIEDDDINLLDIEEDISERLYEHQRQAVFTFFQKNFGVIKVPTRGGKTFIASECIRIHNKYFSNGVSLFVVDSTDLFTQSVDEISKYLGIDRSEIGQIKGTQTLNVKRVNVCTIQTMGIFLKYKKTKESRRMRNLFISFMESVTFLIIDEIHEFGSTARIKNIKLFKPKLFLSLSATPYKSESIYSRMNIQGVTGGIIYEVSEEGLINGDVLVKNKTFILVSENKNRAPKKYSELVDEFIIFNKERNNIIINVLKICVKLKLKTLVLFSSKKHGYIIEEKTGYPFISGDDIQTTRDENKKRFLSKEAGILLATNIYKKGITLPECQVMFNVNEGKEQSLIIQRRGRITGKSKNKKYAVCLDIFDNCDHFRDHSLNRLEAYESLSSDGIEVFMSNSEDFLSDVEFCLSECFYE